MDAEYRGELLKAVQIVGDFLDRTPASCGYWIDEQGHRHPADIGYVDEFLIDLEKYLSGEKVVVRDTRGKLITKSYNLDETVSYY